MNQTADFTDTPENYVYKELDRLNIVIEHSAEALQEVDYWLSNPGHDDTRLLDLLNLPFVTIDDQDARDLDQALYVDYDTIKGYTVYYAIADASYYIKPGTALFKEALNRGSSFYTPAFAIPMLPKALSEDLVSLNPGVPRRAVVFQTQLSDTGQVYETRVFNAKIQSRAKLSYKVVQEWLDGQHQINESYQSSLKQLESLGTKLIESAKQRGMVVFERTEAKVTLSSSLKQFSCHLRERYPVEQYNEQLSLLCNMQGAELLTALQNVDDPPHAVYRVHEAPLEKRMRTLRATLNALAIQRENPVWQWRDDETISEYVDRLPKLEEAARCFRAVQRQILRSQQASSFQQDMGGHHALKASSYARFSSPMREIVGIFTHKELLEALDNDNEAHYNDADLRDEVIKAANASRSKQRELTKSIAFAALFAQFHRELQKTESPHHHATIMGMKKGKLYLSLDDFALEIKVYQEDLELQFGCAYTISDVIANPATSTQPSWQLGDGVSVSVREFDEELSRFSFHIYRLTA